MQDPEALARWQRGNTGYPLVDAAMREFQDAVAGRVGGARGFRQWNKKDLADLCAVCGLVDFQCDIRGGFIFYSAKKPAPAA